MKIQFNAEQPFQLKAVDSVVRLFEGLAKFDKAFNINAFEVIPNLPESEELWEPNLLDNLMAVQDDNGISPKNRLQTAARRASHTSANGSARTSAEMQPAQPCA